MAKKEKKTEKPKAKPKSISKDIKYKITKKNGKVLYRVGLTESEIKRTTEYHGNTIEIVEGE
tara:strand:+ start:1071 stop:1256 length:186 start_codon:yes stop_codon:yes gene_type:complete